MRPRSLVVSVICAAPFLFSVSQAVFAVLNRVLGVEMRKDDSGSFRGSVFVTFADPACARSAVANPPTQIGSSSERLTVMMRQDYDSKAAGGGAGSSRGGSSSKKDRHHGHKRSKGEGGPSPLPMTPGQQPGTAPSSSSGQEAHWRGVAEERERRIRELEEVVRSERDLREREASRTNQVC